MASPEAAFPGQPRTLTPIGAILGIAGVLVALGIRIAWLPLPGLAGDQQLFFIPWASWIATQGLGRAYEQPISFPPVMPWIWWLTGLVDPRLAAAGGAAAGGAATAGGVAADPFTVVLMKLPATLADLGLGALAGWFVGGRDGHSGRAAGRVAWRAGLAAGLAILLVPAVPYISAWWGQFESIYVLAAALAAVLAVRGHRDLGAATAAIALMTKPQALPLMIPLGVWYLAAGGLRGAARAALVAGITAAVLWLPFVPNGGLLAYVDNLRHYQDVDYSVISLRAWNPWWLAQLTLPGRDFVADGIGVGVVTLRNVGFAAAAILLAVVGRVVYRAPQATVLLWAMAAACLAAFVTLTTMHERYSFGALVFLVLLWPDRLAIGTWCLLALAETANVIAAVPPSGGPGSLIPLDGPIGVLGSLAITLAAVLAFVGLARAARSARAARAAPAARAARDELPALAAGLAARPGGQPEVPA